VPGENILITYKPHRGDTNMSNTYSNLLFHVVFSTKERMKLLSKDIQIRLYPYLISIANNNDFSIIKIGGTSDHIHILLSLKPELSISKAVQLLKGNSSKWIHDNFKDMNVFSWQNGYGVFTVSKTQLNIIENYINNQEIHHKTLTFQEEYIELLKRNNIDFNPTYLFN